MATRGLGEDDDETAYKERDGRVGGYRPLGAQCSIGAVIPILLHHQSAFGGSGEGCRGRDDLGAAYGDPLAGLQDVKP